MDVPGIDAPDALMLFNCESNFCSDLHHPLRVDSGTLMLRATAALDSPLRTLLTAWTFVSGDLNRRCRDLFEGSNGVSCSSPMFPSTVTLEDFALCFADLFSPIQCD